MILSCPACKTRYVVPDTAVGPNGRQVRCAACRHSWFQEPAIPAAPIAPAVETTPVPTVAAPVIERIVEPVAADPDPIDYDAYAHEPPFRPRRNPARRWTIAALAAGAVLVAGIGALQYFGTPSLAAKFGLPIGTVEVPLLLEVPRKPERRTLANGNELFALTGRIVNPTAERQRAPDILAELRDAQGRIVYSWTINPPRRTIEPRGAIEFDSAEVDVPKGSRALNLSFSGAQ
jgi:predicted Zn finger-like uncharacterized protein